MIVMLLLIIKSFLNCMEIMEDKTLYTTEFCNSITITELAA